jgi:hypothetical protein
MNIIYQINDCHRVIVLNLEELFELNKNISYILEVSFEDFNK